MSIAVPAPGAGRHVACEPEDLHLGAGREHLHDRAGARLDFRGRLANLLARDSPDFRQQLVGRVGEQLLVKFLDRAAPVEFLARAFSARDKTPCSVITKVSFVKTTVTLPGGRPVRRRSKAMAA